MPANSTTTVRLNMEYLSPIALSMMRCLLYSTSTKRRTRAISISCLPVCLPDASLTRIEFDYDNKCWWYIKSSVMDWDDDDDDDIGRHCVRNFSPPCPAALGVCTRVLSTHASRWQGILRCANDTWITLICWSDAIPLKDTWGGFCVRGFFCIYAC